MDARLSHSLAFVGGIVITFVGIQVASFGHWLLLSPKGPQVASALHDGDAKAEKVAKSERIASRKAAARRVDEGVAKSRPAVAEGELADREARREKRREAMKQLLEGVDKMDPEQRREVLGERLKAMGGDEKLLERMRARAKARRMRGGEEAATMRRAPGPEGSRDVQKRPEADPTGGKKKALVDTGEVPLPPEGTDATE